jgi:hypothetical protein
MNVSIDIKNQIINKIENLSSVQIVYPAQNLNPSGYPAVFVTSASMDGEFVSNQENSRIYAYDLLILFPTGQDYVPEAEKERLDYAEIRVSQVIDDIINAIDNDFELDSLPVLFVNAADCEWGSFTLDNGVAKAAKITLRVYTETVI